MRQPSGPLRANAIYLLFFGGNHRGPVTRRGFAVEFMLKVNLAMLPIAEHRTNGAEYRGTDIGM